MIVLSALLIFLLFSYYIIGQRQKKLYCFIVFISLTLVAALRSYRVGPDGTVYANYFQELKFIKFSEIGNYFTKEPFFYTVTKVLQGWGVGLQGWYGIIGGLFALSISLLIYYYSDLPDVSILALFSLGYYVFSFTGLRQTVALSLVIISAIFLEKRKYVLFFITVFLATLFHNSAIIFLIVFLIRKINFSRKQYAIGAVIGLLGILLLRSRVYGILYYFTNLSERFEGYSGYTYGLSWMGYAIQACIFFYTIVCMDEDAFQDNKFFINLSFTGLFFQLFTVLMAEMFRVSMYFSIFNIIVISNTYTRNRFTEQSKKIAAVIVLGMLLLYFARSHLHYQYSFFF